jgi:Flp pilus assembly protein TadG
MGFIRSIAAAGRRVLAAFARRQDGSPAAEFALVAPIFIVLIFATAQVAIIYIAEAFLETAAEEGARTVLTNNASSMTATQFKTAVCNNLPVLFTCGNVMINLSQAASETSINTAAPTFNSDGTLANPTTYSVPTSGQIGVLQVFYEWPVLGLPLGFTFGYLGNGAYLMLSTQVFIVETP